MFQRRDINIIYWTALVGFVLVKSILRPWILKNSSSSIIEIFVLSYPNFCEAIVGVFVLTMILMYLSKKRLSEKWKLSDQRAYLLATLLAAVYVTTQETKIHNLGGNNIYDPYDLIFSALGLILAFFTLQLLRPSLTTPYRSKELRF